jgi:hypothetical protein
MRYRVFGAVLGLAAVTFAAPIHNGPNAGATTKLVLAASSGPQLIQSTGASETSAATDLTASFQTATLTGSLLVLSASVYTGTTNPIRSVTDTAGNTWTKIGAFASAGHYSDGEMWYSPGARSVTAVTVHTASAAVVADSVQEFSGVAASGALDVSAGTSTTGTSAASGPVTPAADNELAVGFVAGHGNRQALTVTAPGYVAQAQQTSSASTIASVVAAYQLLGSATAQNFTATFSSGMYWAAGIAVFRTVAVLPPPPSDDFSMTAAPGALTITAGQAAGITISTAVTSGTAQNVTFSAAGAPAGTTVAFTPASVTAGQSATMTVTSSSSTPAGTFTLLVTGTGTSVTHAVPVSLTVNPVITSGDPVIAAAGDIACGSGDSNFNGGDGTATACRQKYTSNLLVGAGLTAVLTLGDNMQSDPSPTGFATVYDPTWGRVKSITHPEAGNHDYGYSGAKGYYGYFGAAAGDPTKGYYSYNIGTWHVIEINSNCTKIAGGCAAGSPEETWVKGDLAANPLVCTLAVFHHPRYSSGHDGDNTFMAPIFQDLYDANVDVVLSGHSHDYERFAPQDNASHLDNARGITQFVVGTGGAFFTGFGSIKPNSQVHQNNTFGVLQLTLHPAGYDWRFVPEAGKTWTDSGTRSCH